MYANIHTHTHTLKTYMAEDIDVGDGLRDADVRGGDAKLPIPCTRDRSNVTSYGLIGGIVLVIP
jgi:hypothetical protein